MARPPGAGSPWQTRPVAEIVVALDPGGMTGVAVWRGSLASVELLEVGPLESVDLLWGLAEAHGAGLTVVSESFTVTAQTGKLSQAPWSLECIGAYRWVCRHHGSLFVVPLQRPGDAKGFAPNARLKALGLRMPGGAGHALDAARHLVLLLARSGDPELVARLAAGA
jgi:hypothetical protein